MNNTATKICDYYIYFLIIAPLQFKCHWVVNYNSNCFILNIATMYSAIITVYAIYSAKYKTSLIGTLECYQQSTAIDVHARATIS